MTRLMKVQRPRKMRVSRGQLLFISSQLVFLMFMLVGRVARNTNTADDDSVGPSVLRRLGGNMLGGTDEPQSHDSVSVISSEDNLWDKSTTLPLWMKEYFAWHKEQRSNLNDENWNATGTNYLVLQCLDSHVKCGGTSDRLKPIPLMILLAAKSNRMLFIRWRKPCKLEEFLVPPSGGMDWTVPDWLDAKLDEDPEKAFYVGAEKLMKGVQNHGRRVIACRLQSWHGGMQQYDEDQGEGSFTHVYHDLFRTMFTPSAPIAEILEEEMEAAGLTPGEYAVAHYRAFYAKRDPEDEQIEKTAINAVNCASNLRPGGPVYFASDSTHAVKTVQKYAQETGRPIKIIENQEPLHLDKTDDWRSRSPKDFYSVFIDLYLMGNGRCLSYGEGGFGKYGLMLSYDASCSNKHTNKRKQLIQCEWTDAVTTATA